MSLYDNSDQHHLGGRDDVIDDILRRARQRVFVQSLGESAVFAAAVFAGFCALVLIAGTGLVAFPIAVAAGVAAGGLALFQAFRKRPTLARAARTLDERCGLRDALSTEFHFRESGLEIVQAQRAQAEAAARSVVVEQAIPMRRPRSLYPLAGLAALALLLFGLRFGVERRLDLAAPLTTIFQDPVALAAREDRAAKSREARAKEDQKAAEDSERMSRLGTSTPDDPGVENLPNPAGTAADSGKAQNPNSPPGLSTGKMQDGEKSESGSAEQSQAGMEKAGAEQPPSSRDGAPQGAQGGAKSKNSPDGSGLLSKLKDAMAGLMAKMKPQGSQAPQGGQQSSQQANGKQPNGNQQNGQKGGQDGQKSSDGDPQAGEEDAASSDSEQSKAGDGKGKADQNATAKPGSGMGHSDGSKELKDAEQLAAMGKLSEIIGKRSANVTGEMTIESQSGPQQLKTAYARSTATHAATSGDVTRDEVPVELQGYVQRYFEQVRKQGVRKN